MRSLRDGLRRVYELDTSARATQSDSITQLEYAFLRLVGQALCRVSGLWGEKAHMPIALWLDGHTLRGKRVSVNAKHEHESAPIDGGGPKHHGGATGGRLSGDWIALERGLYGWTRSICKQANGYAR